MSGLILSLFVLLTNLSIKNYALIEELQVKFGSGLTIITGETGAGKSILLGGLSLVLGKRADISAVKNTKKKCVIEATFDIANYNLRSFFSQEDLDYESETIIRREILPSGKSRAFINDSPVNLDKLKNLGSFIIDIHSQHETLEITTNEVQFQIIDALANNNKILEDYSKALKDFKGFKIQLKEIIQQKADALKEQDYNVFLLNELTEAGLVSGELESLESEFETLNNIEDIKEALSNSHALLSNEQIGILDNLNALKSNLSRLSDISSNYSELYERVNSALIELDDVFAEVESAQDNLEADPQRLDQVDSKLKQIHNLLVKHTASDIDELLEIKESLDVKVDKAFNLDNEISKVEDCIKSSELKLRSLADKIHASRSKTIPNLVQQLEHLLSELGMPNARFKIELKTSDEYFSNGSDNLAFLLSANKGAEFKSLKKSASGGELSRIMLAIKSILAEYVQLPTIMFDEIDTGVSGEISNKMAGIMQDMSKNLQVFTITHLPQIAAKGDSHFKVFKEEVEEQTITKLSKLNWDDRIVEIAQMLGGSKLSSSAIEHAKQLLN